MYHNPAAVFHSTAGSKVFANDGSRLRDLQLQGESAQSEQVNLLGTVRPIYIYVACFVGPLSFSSHSALALNIRPLPPVVGRGQSQITQPRALRMQCHSRKDTKRRVTRNTLNAHFCENGVLVFFSY